MGFSVSRQPAYIYQTPSGYIFRFRIPADLRHHVGKSELRYSLRTGALREARHRAGYIASFIRQLVLDLRERLVQFTQDQIASKIRQHINTVLDRVTVRRIPCAYEEEVPKEGQSASAVEPPAKTTTFTDIQRLYEAEVEKAGNWTEKTTAENKTIFALFVRVMGDLPVEAIDRRALSDYKSVLMQLPPNLNISPKHRDRSIEEILASRPEKTLSVNSINKHIRWLSGLFNFAVKNGYMSACPATGLLIRNQRRPDQERGVYTQDDLQKLFGSEEFHGNARSNPYGYWTPLIALYSGCRLEEICQLHLNDIRQQDGVWVLDINEKEEKRLKNMSSVRLVPIHPRLIDLGLLDLVHQLKAKGEQRLFPELRQRRDGYGQTVSKWFQRYKVRCGIEEGKTFHSFRHTFITHLKHKQVDPFMIHELDGHTIDSETMGRYGKRYTPQILLREVIEMIDYGIDIKAFTG